MRKVATPEFGSEAFAVGGASFSNLARTTASAPRVSSVSVWDSTLQKGHAATYVAPDRAIVAAAKTIREASNFIEFPAVPDLNQYPFYPSGSRPNTQSVAPPGTTKGSG